MGIVYRVLICCAVSVPASALYYSWVKTEALGFEFNTLSAIIFTLVSLICVLLTSDGFNLNVLESLPTQPKNTSGRQQGQVKWFNGNKGFGFITCDNGQELFVHFRSVQKRSKRLSPGKQVEFTIVEGKKGPEAEDVVVI